MVFEARGDKAMEAFQNEGGGHRWQRVPPTEKRGRVHTSTVTVAVMREPTPSEMALPRSDLRFKTCRGSGAGGQHRNVTDSAVQLTHIPTGTTVRCESERSQHKNRRKAEALLRARLLCAEQQASSASDAATRRAQVGSGMRGDKRRTIRLQANTVVDHVLGTRMRAKAYVRGEMEPLLKAKRKNHG